MSRSVRGKIVTVGIGDPALIPLPTARKRAVDLTAKLLLGEGVGSPTNTQTLGDLYRAFIAEHAEPHLAPKTLKDYRSYWRLWLSRWDRRPLADITWLEVGKLHVEIGSPSQHTANRVLALLRSMWQWDRDLDLPNPCRGVRRYPEPDREVFLDPTDELPRFLRALAEESDRRVPCYFLLLMMTRARRGSMLTMRWQDIDRERST